MTFSSPPLAPSTSPTRGPDSLVLQDASTPPDLISGGMPVEFRSVKMSRTMFRPTPQTDQCGDPDHAVANPVPSSGKVGGAGGSASSNKTVRRSLFGGDTKTNTSANASNVCTDKIDGEVTAHVDHNAPKKMTLRARTDMTNEESTAEDTDNAYSLMPLYRGLVKRSTRFTTTVPAVQVLRLIHEIIENTPQKPHKQTNAKELQSVSVDFETYRLEVTRGGKRLCRVRIFLMKAGLYMVEFIRDQLDIFQFKRFYENIRAKLSAIVKKDHSLQLLASHRPHGSRPSTTWRKRSHSI